ncbi:MAG: PKD domain-containing protein [Bacteroidia bacterium]
MKVIKYIFFSALLLNAISVLSQNNKVIPPPPLMNPPPQAHFSWFNACFGDTTCFVTQSILCPTYTWTVSKDSVNVFGFHTKKIIQTTYNDSIMCYNFNKIGTYSVELRCYDNHLDSLTQTISIDSIMSLSFYYFNCRDVFVNQSTCTSSFLWDFGDGHTSTTVSPIHQYADTGSYQVTLIGYNGSKSDTLKQQVYIKTIGFVNPAFTYTVSHDTVFVHAVDTDPGNSFNWTWGNGFSTGQDTFHVYKDSTAAYVVTLFAVNYICGPASSHDTIRIIHQPTLIPPPNLDFSNSILTIVPNPVANNGYVDAFFSSYSSADYLTQVYNSLGQKMFEEYFSLENGINEFKISTANFSSGVYLMVLTSGNSYIRKKFYIIDKP